MNSEEVLVGRVLQRHEISFRSGHPDFVDAESLPSGGTLVIGDDGVLIVCAGFVSESDMSLATWTGDEPFVAGDFYFIPWSQLTDATVMNHADVGGIAVRFSHVDGAGTYVNFDNWETATVVSNLSGDFCQASPNSNSGSELSIDLVAVLSEGGFMEPDEIVRELEESYGWSGLDEDRVEEVLFQEDFPSACWEHLWFIDEDADLAEFEDSPLSYLILEALTEEPMSAVEIQDFLREKDGEEYELDLIYDVLYDPEAPTHKKVRSWTYL